MFRSVPAEQAAAAIDRAWELGIRLYDTAPVYGYGLSEQRTGEALGDRPRDELVLCTKVGRLIEAGGTDTQSIWADAPPGIGPRLDYSYAGVYRSLEESLERLGLDNVDVVHIHDPEQNYALAVTEAYRAVSEMRRKGTVGAVSLGVNHADVAARFIRDVGDQGPDCVLLAGRYTLLDQTGAEDFFPLCAERGIAVLAAGVFQGGLLADSSPTAPHSSANAPRELVGRARGLQEIARRHDVPITAAALTFALSHPVVAAAVVGARSPEEVSELAEHVRYPVPQRFWAELVQRGLLAPENATFVTGRAFEAP
jgi:D-threo-aldose 1-dehydrogenase